GPPRPGRRHAGVALRRPRGARRHRVQRGPPRDLRAHLPEAGFSVKFARVVTPIAAVVALAALVVGVATTRIRREGEVAIASCDDAIRRGDRAAATVFAARAARAVAPRSDDAARGYERLAAIARDAEAHGDRAAAAAAWRAMHGAAIATGAGVTWG